MLSRANLTSDPMMQHFRPLVPPCDAPAQSLSLASESVLSVEASNSESHYRSNEVKTYILFDALSWEPVPVPELPVLSVEVFGSFDSGFGGTAQH